MYNSLFFVRNTASDISEPPTGRVGITHAVFFAVRPHILQHAGAGTFRTEAQVRPGRTVERGRGCGRIRRPWEAPGPARRFLKMLAKFQSNPFLPTTAVKNKAKQPRLLTVIVKCWRFFIYRQNCQQIPRILLAVLKVSSILPTMPEK